MIKKGTIYIYNSLTKKKELFNPIINNYIGMYVCGPTVYNHLHLGNYRTFIIFDIVFRYFKHLGYKIRYVRNITDVGHLENEIDYEDKIIKKSRKEGIDPMEIVNKYTISFHKFLNILNILSPNIEPTATGHIIEQIEFIKKLITNNYAYEINGSVYFDLKKYIKKYSYGILSNNKINKLLYEKENILNKEKRYPYDFCLWKKASNKHIMKWKSPWNYGFPGWHTECVTMSTKYLGGVFDIHGGGMDLKFPHHECELAQSNAFYEKISNARYWMHTNMLTINGKKMSKSLGNNLSIIDIYNDYSPNIFKLFILQHHYRSVIDFSLEKLKETKKGYIKIKNTIELINNFIPTNNKYFELNFNVYNWINKCYKSINDDFNTPMLISNIFYASNFIKLELYNINKVNFFLLKKYINYFIFDILGLSKSELTKNNLEYKKFNILVKKLILFRKEMRNKKNWIISDRLRKELCNIGVIINDEKFS
ncbi:cysteine--tRNA ligase [Blattabacterium cuenoti]|uniref:cysteine--tRNA ligase n=1 Tax=Blattabacterium cuenoti TaxID=1653831 RepID=UPI00163BED61|nr:cysteine--tRNA ligase [Blattabacterium cuenoti]